MKTKGLSKKLLAEAIGTFALILIGAGAVCTDAFTGGKIGVTGIAFAHGLTILVMVYAFGYISGTHINPAVSLGLFISKKLSALEFAAYVAAQLVGAGIAGFLLAQIYPNFVHAAPYLGLCTFGGTITPLMAIVIEAVLTFFLVTTVLNVAVDDRGLKPPMGIAIGLTVTAAIFLGGPLTGAALNPARAFGPALAAGNWGNHYVYWVGPLLGSLVAASLYKGIFSKK